RAEFRRLQRGSATLSYTLAMGRPDLIPELTYTLQGVKEEIDEIISAHLATWKLARLPKVTLAVLRLAVGELETFETIPVRVSINEAIELAKKYGTEEDAAYVNGVLGSYAKTLSRTDDNDVKA
ncbi:MAG: transcription antitermination factor NusB, partial [Oscillospiraceae bacterium]